MLINPPKREVCIPTNRIQDHTSSHAAVQGRPISVHIAHFRLSLSSVSSAGPGLPTLLWASLSLSLYLPAHMAEGVTYLTLCGAHTGQWTVFSLNA